MKLFAADINSWQDWGKVFRSVTEFAPMAEYILKMENLPPAEIEPLTPGTNAVFRAGGYAMKIFAPAESGID